MGLPVHDREDALANMRDACATRGAATGFANQGSSFLRHSSSVLRHCHGPEYEHQRPAFDTHASTTMSVCDGRERERDWTKSVGAFAAGPVSSLHHRFAHFRQWHLDANDGAELGPEW